jgi:hypothetical protein
MDPSVGRLLPTEAGVSIPVDRGNPWSITAPLLPPRLARHFQGGERLADVIGGLE